MLAIGAIASDKAAAAALGSDACEVSTEGTGAESPLLHSNSSLNTCLICADSPSGCGRALVRVGSFILRIGNMMRGRRQTTQRDDCSAVSTNKHDIELLKAMFLLAKLSNTGKFV